tara:strand:+ start:14832 stop:16406 length:1575 start_codon:yes stop_codon:yes gene_type:complete
MKLKGEKTDYVISLLDEDNTLTVTEAVRKMCIYFDIIYTESIRKGISSNLSKASKLKSSGKVEESEALLFARGKKLDKEKKTFIITWAQNNTPIHKNFFKNIIAYKDSLDAGLHIIAGRYNNPTSIWGQKSKEGEFWSPKVVPYLDAARHNLHKNLQVLSDIKIPPTGSTPLSGLNSVTGLESCIVGHPRQQVKSLPILVGYPHKLLLSTGSCTVPNYTDSKSGKKGEFHHCIGFIIVEMDGKNFHIRQVSADNNGNFYDLYKRVKDGEVLENTEGAEAAVLGDIHIAHNDTEATELSFKLLDKMKPKHTMIHDIIDCESISHHEENDPFRLMQKEENGTGDLKKELDIMLEWVKGRLKYNLVIVRSNHDDFLDRWLKSVDWRRARNKRMFLFGAEILANEPIAKEKGVISWMLENEFGDKIKTLGLDDSFRVLGWELGVHGHVGANGSRGGHNQYKNMNTKMITGHTHSPNRGDGHMTVGTNSGLRVGYNKGASSWMHANALIYPDGKAQLIYIVNGKYCRDM